MNDQKNADNRLNEGTEARQEGKPLDENIAWLLRLLRESIAQQQDDEDSLEKLEDKVQELDERYEANQQKIEELRNELADLLNEDDETAGE